MKKELTLISLAAMLATGANATSLEERVKALEEKNEILSEELLKKEESGFTFAKADQSYNGMGAAASKVYYAQSGLSIGGYGEMYWAKTEGKRAFADVYRFIPYFGYRFNDWIVMNAEIEFEHGGEEVAIEFLYLDFMLDKSFNVRLGNLLVPMGLTNLRHEPTLFNTVQRPEIEKLLIPSTWHENGILAYGELAQGAFAYSVGAINALNVNTAFATDITSAKREQWLRKGRKGSAEKATFSPAFVGRLDYKGINGLLIGASAYYGDASNTDPDLSGANLSIFDLHAQYEKGPFSAKALYTQANVSGAEKLGADTIQKASGFYLNTAYDVADALHMEYKLPVFVQYERYNPIEETVSGAGELEDISIVTAGFNFYPTEQVVLKADYAIKDDPARADKERTASFGLGFIF